MLELLCLHFILCATIGKLNMQNGTTFRNHQVLQCVRIDSKHTDEEATARVRQFERQFGLCASGCAIATQHLRQGSYQAAATTVGEPASLQGDDSTTRRSHHLGETKTRRTGKKLAAREANCGIGEFISATMGAQKYFLISEYDFDKMKSRQG